MGQCLLILWNIQTTHKGYVLRCGCNCSRSSLHSGAQSSLSNQIFTHISLSITSVRPSRWQTVSLIPVGLTAQSSTSRPGTLPACTPSSCAPCNIGASTMCISFPYNNIDQVTSTVSVVPYITQYDDGRLSTSFSTVTFDEDPECDFFDEDQFTWVTHGRTL